MKQFILMYTFFFVGYNKFYTEIHKLTPTTTKCSIYDLCDNSLLFEKMVEDHKPSALSEVNQICLNS